jgi:hypothetical protein
MFKPGISPGLKQKTLEGPTAEALRDTRQDMSVRVELAQVLRVGASCRLTYDLFLRRGEGDEGGNAGQLQGGGAVSLKFQLRSGNLLFVLDLISSLKLRNLGLQLSDLSRYFIYYCRLFVELF